MRILLVGPYPPRIGGIATHVQRMVAYLNTKGYQAQVLDYSGSPEEPTPNVITLPTDPLLRMLSLVLVAVRTPADTVIHIHIAMMNLFKWAAPLLLFLFWRQPKLISLHAGALFEEVTSARQRRYVRWILAQFARIIAVSEPLAAEVVELGIPQERIVVIPAFIPAQPDPDLIPGEIRAVAKSRTLVITSGTLTDLYNHDVLIDCIEQLPSEQWAFIFAFYFQPEPVYEKHIKNRLTAFNNVFVYQGLTPEHYLSIVSVCDIYVRTSRVDGDSVAIREADSLGLSVFASDSVWRPDFCQLFPLTESSVLLDMFHRYAPPAVPGNRETINEHPNAASLERIYLALAHKR